VSSLVCQSEADNDFVFRYIRCHFNTRVVITQFANRGLHRRLPHLVVFQTRACRPIAGLCLRARPVQILDANSGGSESIPGSSLGQATGCASERASPTGLRSPAARTAHRQRLRDRRSPGGRCARRARRPRQRPRLPLHGHRRGEPGHAHLHRGRAARSDANGSGREDSNLRLPGPKPGALPGCATPRCSCEPLHEYPLAGPPARPIGARGYFFFGADLGSLGAAESSFSAGARDGVLPPAQPK
jgi:hypothetical protein